MDTAPNLRQTMDDVTKLKQSMNTYTEPRLPMDTVANLSQFSDRVVKQRQSVDTEENGEKLFNEASLFIIICMSNFKFIE